jgi:hypothetical protein
MVRMIRAGGEAIPPAGEVDQAAKGNAANR